MLKMRRSRLHGSLITRTLTVVLLMGLVGVLVLAPGCGKKSTPPGEDTGPGSSQVEKKSTKGFIVFERDYRLYRADEDGAGQKSITDGFDTTPAVSADGERIAYAHAEADPRAGTTLSSVPPPAVSIYAANPDGEEAARVTPEEWGTSTGWEPLFTRQEGTVWVQRDCAEPSFSRDGDNLAFIIRDHAYQETADGGRGEYGLEAVAVIGLSGPQKGELTILVRSDDLYGGGSFSNPRFSSDGAYVYFNEAPGGGPPDVSISRVTEDGGGKTVIAQGGTEKGYYAFDLSPSDGGIAAAEMSMGSSGGGFTGKIVLMDLDGSNMRSVETGGAYVGSDNLCFSPDGAYLAFSTQEFGRQTQGAPSDIYTVKTDGTGLTTVITNGRGAAWGKASSAE